MINGAHVILYSTDADADRAFFKDILGYPNVDAGDGWLIFKLPPAEIALHPASTPAQEFYLMCDDVHATVAELSAKGVEFVAPVADRGWGLLTVVKLPSGGELGLYEPRHERAHDL
jgi:catechol 2,3-dioxygenase-like lactoylglutathione lyase family enzyme